jgi:putrescine transport system permease protein
VGFALLLLFAVGARSLGLSIPRGSITLIAAHATLGFAYSTVLLRASLSRADASIIDAAADLGAAPFDVFFRVVVPTQLPAIVAAWLVSFLLSLDDVIISSFVTGPGYSTLPMVVFSSVRLGLSPQVNALATVLFAVVTAIMITASLLLLRYGKILEGGTALAPPRAGKTPTA